MVTEHSPAPTSRASSEPGSSWPRSIDLVEAERLAALTRVDLAALRDDLRVVHDDEVVYPADKVLSPIRRVDVLGVQISGVDISRSVDEIESWVNTAARSYVCVSGAHGVLESTRDEDLARIHNEAGLTVPDGMPMVWAGRSVGLDEIGHVRGSDLMLAVLERAQELGWRSYFYGGQEGIPERLVERLRERFPDLEVAGCYSPPFRVLTPEEDEDVVRRINDSGADLVWVGLSTPKQERWMAKHRDRLDASALLGVGAAFDYHAGCLRQAPVVFQNSGLEWVYRLASEPRRLWRRYLVGHSQFAYRALRNRPTLVKRIDLGDR
jgi:N-acetylglucosaminyldiphosphoundecaprenol N-acetyl-beta-D-mannosaminyltransferase